jgi:hypothetical protein
MANIKDIKGLQINDYPVVDENGNLTNHDFIKLAKPVTQMGVKSGLQYDNTEAFNRVIQD